LQIIYDTPESTRYSNPNFGQWVYIQIPEVEKFTWHPFSLATEAGDDKRLDMQIGIRTLPGENLERDPADAGRPWTLTNKSWTYKLYRALKIEKNSKGPSAKIPCKIMGPYGSAFENCFAPEVKGSLVLGAGTGLSSALSALRQYVRKKKMGHSVPEKLWFVWSTGDAMDLFRCWNPLFDLLYECYTSTDNNRVPILGPKEPNPMSKCLNWLYITIYLTSSKTKLKDITEDLRMATLRGLDDDGEDEVKVDLAQKQLKKAIFEWLTNEKRIIMGKMDSEKYHIKKLMKFFQKEIDRGYIGGKAKEKMSVAYCGPAPLVGTLRSATEQIGARCEFNADFI